MKQSYRTAFDILLYLFVFLAFQIICPLLCQVLLHGKVSEATELIAGTGLASVLTLAVFVWCRWMPFNRRFLRSRPWLLLFWVLLLSLGTLIPSLWLEEALEVELPEAYQQVFEQIMGSRGGYLVVGILAPLVEEIVFRGAILRAFLTGSQHQSADYTLAPPCQRAWMGIALTALLFALVHFNLAQGVHAFLLGLLLGWLYWRTGSIVPGVVLHWMNNSVAYAIYRIMPQWNDAKLVDIFSTERNVLLAVAFSLMIFLPALYQVWLLSRSKR